MILLCWGSVRRIWRDDNYGQSLANTGGYPGIGPFQPSGYRYLAASGVSTGPGSGVGILRDPQRPFVFSLIRSVPDTDNGCGCDGDGGYRQQHRS